MHLYLAELPGLVRQHGLLEPSRLLDSPTQFIECLNGHRVDGGDTNPPQRSAYGN